MDFHDIKSRVPARLFCSGFPEHDPLTTTMEYRFIRAGFAVSASRPNFDQANRPKGIE